jgi:hypothetical protein
MFFYPIHETLLAAVAGSWKPACGLTFGTILFSLIIILVLHAPSGNQQHSRRHEQGRTKDVEQSGTLATGFWEGDAFVVGYRDTYLAII